MKEEMSIDHSKQGPETDERIRQGREIHVHVRGKGNTRSWARSDKSRRTSFVTVVERKENVFDPFQSVSALHVSHLGPVQNQHYHLPLSSVKRVVLCV